MNQAPSMLKPALIAGAAFGVAGSIPILNLINCACCALIIGAGFLAAFLYSKDSRSAGVPFRPGNGATVGLLAGLVYGAVSGVLGGAINAAMGATDFQDIIEAIEMSNAEIDPEILAQISQFMDSSGVFLMILFGVFFALLFGAIFGTIGGLIGGSVFKHAPQASATYDQAPPPPPVG